MNRRDLFKGAFASFFAFVGAKLAPDIYWEGTRVPKRYSYIYRNRVAEGIINAHIDELTMGLNPIRVAYKEIQASDIRVFRASGKCDLNSFNEET